jgi:zinc D-Ala-D-Ala carboxypeptidase
MIWTKDNWNFESWPNFSFDEMKCTHCGRNEMDVLFMTALQQIRRAAGALTVSSGFRCPEHPVEEIKQEPGAHTFGKAVDLAVRGAKALSVVKMAVDYGMMGVGVSQKGDSRFIHLDMMNNTDDGGRFPRPTIWSY